MRLVGDVLAEPEAPGSACARHPGGYTYTPAEFQRMLEDELGFCKPKLVFNRFKFRLEVYRDWPYRPRAILLFEPKQPLRRRHIFEARDTILRNHEMGLRRFEALHRRKMEDRRAVDEKAAEKWDDDTKPVKNEAKRMVYRTAHQRDARRNYYKGK